MKAITGKDFAKLLENKGWVLLRTKSSHHIYVKKGMPIGPLDMLLAAQAKSKNLMGVSA